MPLYVELEDGAYTTWPYRVGGDFFKPVKIKPR